MKQLFLVFCLSQLCACIVNHHHDDLQLGIHSFMEHNYRRAFISLMPEAAKGQKDAQYAVGYMYYYGQGVVEDRQQACYWIHKAACAGQVDAIHAVEILKQCG